MATIELGIGSVKVEALATWAVCSNLIVNRSGRYHITPMARLIRQYDPWLQEHGTWWCIHHALVLHHEPWRWYTTQFEKTEFSIAELDSELAMYLPHLNPVSIQNARRALMQTMNSTPLGDTLGLAIPRGKGRYSRRPKYGSIGQAVLAYALLHWARENHRLTANLAELIQPYGPGRVFGLRLADLGNVLNRIQEAYREQILVVSRTAGLNSVGFNLQVDPLHLLETYYVEYLQGLEPYEALQWSCTEGYSARLLASKPQT